MPVTLRLHPVHVQASQVGHDLGQQGGEAVEMVVAVVQVVNDSNVGDALSFEPVDDGELVFRLAEPAPVVIEGQRAPDLSGLLGEWTELCRRRGDPALLLRAGDLVGAQVEQHPEVGLLAAPLQEVENDSRFAIELAGSDPEGVETNSVTVECIDFGVEAGDMLGAPVVGESPEAEMLEHGRALFGTTLLTIERYDAPRDEILAQTAAGPQERSCRAESLAAQGARSGGWPEHWPDRFASKPQGTNRPASSHAKRVQGGEKMKE